jgi:hypothetical protein
MAALRLRTLLLLLLAAVAEAISSPATFETKLPRLIKQDAECKSLDRYICNANSYLDCAKQVGDRGGKYFSFGKVDSSQPTPPPTKSDASGAADVKSALQVAVMQSAVQMMKVGACYMEFNYDDNCTQAGGYQRGAFDFFALDTFRVELVMLNQSQECTAPESYIGKFHNVTACAEAVLAKPDGQFFVYGNSNHFLKQGSCYLKRTTSHTCPEGFTSNGGAYDFWGLKFTKTMTAAEAASRRRAPQQAAVHGANQGSGGYVGDAGTVRYRTLKSGSECLSTDQYLGWYTTKEGCVQAVQDNGGKFASYGSGTKMWLCYQENTDTSSCSEGFEVDSFDFVEIVQPTQPPSPSPQADTFPDMSAVMDATTSVTTTAPPTTSTQGGVVNRRLRDLLV